MEITINVPDAVAGKIFANRQKEISRTVLESIALEEYRKGRLTHFEVGQILGLATLMQVDAFLQQAGVELEYTFDDLERDTATIEKILKK